MVSDGAPLFRVAFDAMASHCEIRMEATGEDAAHAIARQAIDEVRRIEAKYSRYRADSVVSRINSAAGMDWVEHDGETGALLDFAGTLFDASGGLFDITSGVLRRAWDFRQGVVPSEEELAALLPLIGWGRVTREGNRIRLPQPGMEIDFGGFGKEYAADRAASILRARGVRHGYVNLGGDFHVIGPQPGGEPWMIGIQDPRQPQSCVASIPVTHGGLATSGDYERYFERDGRRYCHILDPRTGQPVTAWRSVSVLGPLAVAAGSGSTIAMLSQDAAIDFLDHSGMAYLAIDATGHTFSRNP
ncbi:FAD:protein FMN transferase [Noviherbaspirillum denitrificans]|uniref:FAD:protein FMN transferase n=1 Tax=Noviherbaspirillum denitrificans TaxID=1968433 RepID=A0A254TFW0_9BURK|nr:FAD:protein FMN transferase [Noviherbaspirillum denitrificans]OWW19423.1 thiamine biosynthesis protein ApbE [Noviherbaspirillum denitrificans]